MFFIYFFVDDSALCQINARLPHGARQQVDTVAIVDVKQHRATQLVDAQQEQCNAKATRTCRPL